MFVEKCFYMIKFLNGYRKQLKYILLLVAPFTLIIKPEVPNLYSMESMHNLYEFSPEHEFLSYPLSFINKSPNETIFIKLEGSKDFEFSVKSWVDRLKVRSKSILLSRETPEEHYFVTIYLKEGDENKNLLFPLRRYQSNSDLVFLANYLFQPVVKFSLRHLLLHRFEQSIYISLKNDKSSMIKLCTLLRYYSNIYSHALGIYFYIPFYNKIIKQDSFAIFIAICILLFILDDCPRIDLLASLLKILIFYFIPLSCIFFIKSTEKHVLALFFIAIDFNFGIFYTFLGYLLILGRAMISKKTIDELN